LIDRFGPIGLAVPAHVGCHRMEPGIREGPKLVAPGIPRLREPMAEDDQGARPLLGDVHANAVRLDGAVLDLAHGRLLCNLTTAASLRASIPRLGRTPQPPKDPEGSR